MIIKNDTGSVSLYISDTELVAMLRDDKKLVQSVKLDISKLDSGRKFDLIFWFCYTPNVVKYSKEDIERFFGIS